MRAKGDQMDKEKVLNIVKQMSDVCGIDLAESSLMLMPQNAEGIPSSGDQLHVKAELNFGSRLCLYALMDEYKLKVRETPEKIVIINPTGLI